VELRSVVAALLVAACSGGKPKVASEDAKPIVHPGDAAVAREAAPIAPGKGDVSVRIEWHDVPVDARAGKACGPDVAPTTTWGIPDAVVVLAGPAPASGAGAGSAAARVVVGRCITPRVQIASQTLVIASGLMQPTALSLDDKPVMLPIAGHEVTAALAPGRHTLVDGDARAWVVTEPLAAITDGSGVAILRDVPTGVYPVTAWLPTANRSAKGEITVTAGALAEVTLQLQPSP
jgi:hypothetical protein